MPFYTYAIEITEDGETWMPEDAASVGTVGAQGSAQEVAQDILEGRLGEADDVGPKDCLRVMVWHGETQDTLSMAAAVVYAPEVAPVPGDDSSKEG